jgi:predicted metal-binding membrane protein
MAPSEQGKAIDGAGSNWWHDRGTLLIAGLLIAVAILAWGGVISQSRSMPEMKSDMDMNMAMSSPPVGLSFAGAVNYLVAWGIMMAAMMLPSATPMIALYNVIQRNFPQTGQKGVSTALFTLVYLALWTIFGLPIYIASIIIDSSSQTWPALAQLLPYALAGVLFIAGVYQFSPLKRACLRVCQSPLGFLMGHWHGGYLGTLKMAWEHAAYCIGCCWVLMVVLVAVGAMGLPWVLLIGAFVAAEKLLPGGERLARLGGVALVLLGLLVIFHPELATTLRGQGM